MLSGSAHAQSLRKSSRNKQFFTIQHFLSNVMNHSIGIMHRGKSTLELMHAQLKQKTYIFTYGPKTLMFMLF